MLATIALILDGFDNHCLHLATLRACLPSSQHALLINVAHRQMRGECDIVARFARAARKHIPHERHRGEKR